MNEADRSFDLDVRYRDRPRLCSSLAIWRYKFALVSPFLSASEGLMFMDSSAVDRILMDYEEVFNEVMTTWNRHASHPHDERSYFAESRNLCHRARLAVWLIWCELVVSITAVSVLTSFSLGVYFVLFVLALWSTYRKTNVASKRLRWVTIILYALFLSPARSLKSDHIPASLTCWRISSPAPSGLRGRGFRMIPTTNC